VGYSHAVLLSIAGLPAAHSLAPDHKPFFYPSHPAATTPKLYNQQTNKSTNQQINKSTNQQINKSTNQQINKSTNQQINKSTNQQPTQRAVARVLPTLKDKAKYGCWLPSFARRGERGVGGVSGGETTKNRNSADSQTNKGSTHAAFAKMQQQGPLATSSKPHENLT
jgi:hypothetical protein